MSSIEPCSSKKDTKHEYVLDKTYAFKACMKYLKGLLENAAALIALKKVPVRPGRSFPRTLRRQSADTFNYR